MVISVIVGFKNRDIIRATRYLEAFKNQIFGDFELLFVDYGSDIELAREIKSLVETCPFCKHIYNNTRLMPWNRSHALNTGLRLAQGEFIFFSDIDHLYSENF